MRFEEHACNAPGCTNTTTNKYYCSLSCSNTGTPRRSKTRQRVPCIYCNKIRIEKKNVVVKPYCNDCNYHPKYVVEILKTRVHTPSKKLLYKSGLEQAKCEWCGIVEWRDLPAPLEVDHIDGNRKNNCIENLRILCRNCHGQTDTFCSKNSKRYRNKMSPRSGSAF